MRRHAIAAIAAVFLSAAAALWLWPPVEGGSPAFEAALWRVGAVLVVLWLAYPDLRRMPAWLLGVVPIVAVLVAARPRWFIFLVPILLVLGVLQSLRRRPPK
ncbi:MAG TPA: hypothetical protein DD670_05125 [Planctomycetaceae bacterium]|nr:hypothetical protein [Planctomycetaceae bacterium]